MQKIYPKMFQLARIYLPKICNVSTGRHLFIVAITWGVIDFSNGPKVKAFSFQHSVDLVIEKALNRQDFSFHISKNFFPQDRFILSVVVSVPVTLKLVEDELEHCILLVPF